MIEQKNIVFISGWAGIGESLDYLWPENISIKKFAPCYFFENKKQQFPSLYAKKIIENINTKSTIIGWSLGGMVAQEIAAMKPELVSKLILINATDCFVKTVKNPYGVEVETVQSMKQNLEHDLESTLKNFISFAYARNKEDFILPRLKSAMQFSLENLLFGLDYLLNMDLSNLDYQADSPIYILHSKEDVIINPKSSTILFTKAKNKKLVEINSSNHACYASIEAKEVIKNLLYGN